MEEENCSYDSRKTEFVKNLENLLNSRQCEDALNMVRQDSGRLLVESEALNMIPVIAKFIRPEVEDEFPELIDCCQEILEELASTGNPKEMLIGLLEQAESSIENFKFKAMLTPIQIVLQRMPTKRGKSLHWVLKTLNVRVKNLPVPKSYNLENEERKLLDLDPNTEKIARLLSQLLKFYEPFVCEVSLKTSSKGREQSLEEERTSQREMLTKSLLGLLDHPLAFVCLDHKAGEAKSNLRVISEKIVHLVTHLQSNLLKLFKYVDKDPKGPKGKLSSTAIASFFYLVYAEEIEILHWPQVFSHVYLLETCLPIINMVLSNPHDYAKHKGLLLGASFLAKMPAKRLDVAALDFGDHRMFAQNLINVMVYCSIQEFRSLAVKMLQDYVCKFDYPARFQLTKRLLISNSHPGVQGLLIQSVKNNIVETLKQDPPETCYLGDNLHEILFLVVPLVAGPETDLLEQSDRIMGALNFLRYLALMDDRDKNVTGFWDKVTFVENELLNPLHKALDLSRAHYQLTLRQESEKGLSDNDIADVNMTIGNQLVPRMTSEKCFQMLHSALNTFDVIEGVLARVVEIISAPKTK